MGVRRSWRLLLFTLAACILGYYGPEGKLSFHILTGSVVTAVLLSVPIGLLPRRISLALQILQFFSADSDAMTCLSCSSL